MTSISKSLQTTLDRVGHALRINGLANRKAPLLVAISGGPDSTTLLHTLTRLRETMGLNLHAAHLDHGLNNLSLEDPEMVADLAQSLGVTLTTEKIDIFSYAQEQKLSLEDAARRMRYAFLTRVSAQCGADTVALGHTADDQAETVLLHLVRGAGLRGLRGMQTLTFWKDACNGKQVWLFRPMLDLERVNSEVYCNEVGLQPLYDASNQWPRFTRNRIRLEVLPLLSELNVSVRDALLRLGKSATVDDDFLEQEARNHWQAVVREENEALYLKRRSLSRLHPALQRRLVQQAYAYYTDSDNRLSHVHVEKMIELIESPPERRIALPGNVTFSNGYEECLLGPKPEEVCPLPPFNGRHILRLPGTTHCEYWEVISRLRDPSRNYPATGSLKAFLDAGALAGGLELRTRRPGDRIYPLGLETSQRIQKFFVDHRVPRSWRDRVPLLVSGSKVAWVVGHRIAHWARVTPGTRQVLAIELRRLDDDH